MQSNKNNAIKFILICLTCIGLVTLLAMGIQALT